MATFTWLGGGSNSFGSPSDWNPSGPPGTGDTIIMPAGLDMIISNATLTNNLINAGSNDAISLANAVIDGGSLTVGAGSTLTAIDSTLENIGLTVGNGTTINLRGDITPPGTSGFTGTVILTGTGSGQPQLSEAGAGDRVVLNTAGSVENDGIIFATSSGGSFTVSATSAATATSEIPGYLRNSGAFIAEAGDPLSISAGAGSVLANAGALIVAGGTLTLNAAMDATAGEIAVGSGSVDVASPVPFSQHLLFDDDAGHLTLEPAAAGTFAASIGGFQPGDTILLSGLAATGLVFAYADGLLTLDAGGTVEAKLRFQGAQFVDGAGSVGGANATSFNVASDGAGDTIITATQTVADWNGVTGGGTIDWSAANWSNGSGTGGIPGTLQTALIANSLAELATFKKYVLTVGTAESVGSVVLDDHFAQLVVTRPLTLHGRAGQGDGGEFLATAGSVDIASGGVLTTKQLFSLDKLAVDAGGTLAASGVQLPAVQAGFDAVDVENAGSITGGLVTGGAGGRGAFIIGQNNGGDVTMTGGAVQVSYTQLGGQAQGNGQLDISGATTSWQDLGDAANTADTGAWLGDILIGGGGFNPDGSVPIGGSGNLTVDLGATLTEAGAAMLGISGNAPGIALPAVQDSFGFATIRNGARWNIGTFLDVGGSPLYNAAGQFGGVGSVTLQSGGVVQLGTAETLGQYKVALGATKGSSGQITVNGGSLDTGGGAIAIGEAQAAGGALVVNSGTVTAGAATPGISWGAVIGDGGATGTLAAANGSLSVGGPGSAMFSVQGDLVDGNAGLAQAFVGSGGTVSVAGTLTIGEAAGSVASLAVNGGGTVTLPLQTGVIIGAGGAAGTLAAASGSLTVGGTSGTGAALLSDAGDFVDGVSGHAHALVNAGGTVNVGGTLFVGGFNTPGGSSTMDVNGGLLTANAVQLWPGSTLAAESSAIVAIGGASGAQGIDIASGATVFGAGVLSGNLNDNGNVVADVPEAALQLTGGSITGSGTLTVAPVGTLDIFAFVHYTNPVAFSGPGGVLRLEAPTALQGPITDFGAADAIDLPGATFPPAHTLSYDGVAGVLHFGADAFQIGTGYAGKDFALEPEAVGTGTEIVFVACFAAGTRVLTAHGEVPVEALVVGDAVPTLSGRLRRLRWIGRTRIDPGRHPQPERVAPIRVAAGAFAAGVPHRALRLSPDHAVFVDGVLVPVHRLVNGASIAREPAGGVVEYLHLELDRHDVVLADGLRTESYLDTGNREMFTEAEPENATQTA